MTSSDLPASVDPSEVRAGRSISIAARCVYSTAVATATIERVDDGATVGESIPLEHYTLEPLDDRATFVGVVDVDATYSPGRWLIRVLCPHGPSPHPLQFTVLDTPPDYVAPPTTSDESSPVPPGLTSEDLPASVEPSEAPAGGIVTIEARCVRSMAVPTVTFERVDANVIADEPAILGEVIDPVLVDNTIGFRGAIALDPSYAPGDWLARVYCAIGPSPEPVAFTVAGA